MSIEKTISQIKGDKRIWLIVFFLGLFSILAVYSATGSNAYTSNGKAAEYYLVKQILFMGLGFVLMYVTYRLDYVQYYRSAKILLFLSLPLLFYTMVFGTEINDARRWITLPWIDQTFQTSDFARLALIIYLAKSISQKQAVIKNFKSAFLPLIVPVIVVAGMIAPNDLSTAGLLFVTSLLLMFMGRVHLKYIFLLIFAGVVMMLILIVLGYQFPEHIRVETWVARVTEFFYDSDGGYQIQQSKIAIAEGGLFGSGPGLSIQRNYLPSPYTDFIYAVIVEEYGLVGGVFIILLYLGLLIQSIRIVTRSPKTFGAMLAIGLTLNIVVQAFANIAVSVHILPVTGITLPMVSAGGTSLMITAISLGIILSVSRYVDQAQREKIALQEIEELNEGNN